MERSELEVEIRCAVARLMTRNRALGSSFIHPSKLRKQSEEYLVRPALPGFTTDVYTARTLAAHKESVETLAERQANGVDLWTGQKVNADEIDYELTDSDRTFIAKVLSLSNPCQNRRKLLTCLEVSPS